MTILIIPVAIILAIFIINRSIDKDKYSSIDREFNSLMDDIRAARNMQDVHDVIPYYREFVSFWENKISEDEMKKYKTTFRKVVNERRIYIIGYKASL
jgi:hypothetical protein